MTDTIVFAFAAAKGLQPVVGAAPFSVLARQIPRQLVSSLNEAGDHGFRFFPFMGTRDGQRQFFEVEEAFSPEMLLRLHGQDQEPTWLVDGHLYPDRAQVRILDGSTARVAFDEEIPFSPSDPWPLLKRMQFELMERAGLQGRGAPLPELEGTALAWYLIAKDELLAMEAGMAREDSAAGLRAMGEAFAAAPGDLQVQQLMLDLCAQSVRSRELPEAAAALLLEAADCLAEPSVPFLESAARIVEAASGTAAARPLYSRLAERRPGHPHAVIKVASALYQEGAVQEGRDLLERALESGTQDPRLRAQLAIAEEQAGNLQRSRELLDELSRDDELPGAVARIVVHHLLSRGREGEALELADRGLQAEPEHAGLHLERGRALMALNRGGEAEQSLRRCLELKPNADTKDEAERCLGLLANPEVLPQVHQLEAMLATGQEQAALALVVRMLREQRQLPEAWLFLGVVRQRLGHQRRAIRAYRRAIALREDIAEAQNRLGVLLATRGKLDEGRRHLERSVELDSNQSGPWLHLAQVLVHLGDREAGRDALERARTIGDRPEQVRAVQQSFFAD